LSGDLCSYYVCNATLNNTCLIIYSNTTSYDVCGVCGGDNTTCIPVIYAVPATTSISAAVGIGVGVSGAFAVAAGIIAGRKGYDQYKELACELNGKVQNSGAYKGAENGGENPLGNHDHHSGVMDF